MKTIIATAAAVVLTASLAGFAAPSVASSAGFTGMILCDSRAHGAQCWTAPTGRLGIDLTGTPYHSGSLHQRMDELTAYGVCPGGPDHGSRVTNSCPFIKGTALNSFFRGKTLVTLSNFSTGHDYAARWSPKLNRYVIRQANGGTGIVFVLDGRLLVSVFASSQNAELQRADFACTDSRGKPLRFRLISVTNLGALPSACRFRVRKGRS